MHPINSMSASGRDDLEDEEGGDKGTSGTPESQGLVRIPTSSTGIGETHDASRTSMNRN